MGAQHVAALGVKRVLHGAGGVVLRDVQRLEIVEIVFNLGTVCHVKTHAVKQLHHALQGERYGVQAACGLPARWQGYVQGFGGEFLLQLGGGKGGAFGIVGSLKTGFAFVDVRADGFFIFHG